MHINELIRQEIVFHEGFMLGWGENEVHNALTIHRIALDSDPKSKFSIRTIPGDELFD